PDDSPATRPPGELRFVALASVASSADHWRARLVALAAIRVEDGRLSGAFETLFNPRCRLPRYLIEATGLSLVELEAAPPFAEQVEPLLEFLADLPLAGLEIEVQLATLGQELS